MAESPGFADFVLAPEYATTSCNHRDGGTINPMDGLQIHVADTDDRLKDHVQDEIYRLTSTPRTWVEGLPHARQPVRY